MSEKTKSQRRPVYLTADADCERCDGTGKCAPEIIIEPAMSDPDFSAHMCSCVEAVTLYLDANGALCPGAN